MQSNHSGLRQFRTRVGQPYCMVCLLQGCQILHFELYSLVCSCQPNLGLLHADCLQTQAKMKSALSGLAIVLQSFQTVSLHVCLCEARLRPDPQWCNCDKLGLVHSLNRDQLPCYQFTLANEGRSGSLSLPKQLTLGVRKDGISLLFQFMIFSFRTCKEVAERSCLPVPQLGGGLHISHD